MSATRTTSSTEEWTSSLFAGTSFLLLMAKASRWVGAPSLYAFPLCLSWVDSAYPLYHAAWVFRLPHLAELGYVVVDGA